PSWQFLSAIPMRSDGSRRPTRSEATAVPSPPVKSRAAIPEGWATGTRPLPRDRFGRLIARQKTVAVPRTIQRALSGGTPGRCGQRQQAYHNRRDKSRDNKALARTGAGFAVRRMGRTQIAEWLDSSITHRVLLSRVYRRAVLLRAYSSAHMRRRSTVSA